MNTSSMYALRDVPGKGKGLVAIENISKGTRILSELPVITTPMRQRDSKWLKTHVSQQIDSLNETQRQLFFSMYNRYPYENVVEQSFGILRTNSLPIEDNGIEGGIFLEACRINHACDNNAQKHWNSSIKQHTVHALRDISASEEITIYYLGPDSSRAIRHERLQRKFGFLCCCRLCSLSAEQSQESDKRLARIDQLDDIIGREGMQSTFPLKTLHYIDERVRLYNEQGPGNVGLPRAYLDAAQLTIANGDLARGRVFAERAVEGLRTALGSDSKEVIKHGALARNPEKFQLYGNSFKWKTSSDEVPQGLGSNDFEDWLWRREKPKMLGPVESLANLRNREIFPSFAALPNSHMDSDWYEDVDGFYQPLHRWCFLGEICNSATLHHLELELTDVDDKKVTLHFYTDDRGKDMAPKIQEGHTVAVLYGKRHVFVYRAPGIRHEDPQMFKIFPLSLKKLLELNDLVEQFSTIVGETRTCHGCSKKSPSLNRCGKCSLFWYCNTDCQKTGWNERGHKANCKLLKDPDLRGLFEGVGKRDGLKMLYH